MFKQIEIYPGFDKSDCKEKFQRLVLKPGEVYTIVGPTGSGKTQLFEDIETLNNKEGVTKREIIARGRAPKIAHLSQKMNYMVDMSVMEFIKVHGRCLGIIDINDYAMKVLKLSNELSGEKIKAEDNLTKLSGGQSRSLMIADVAMNRYSDIVLLDEIENAGIDRLKVLKILIQANKLILLITHDPLLALLGHHRIVLENGGIKKIVTRTVHEERLSEDLIILDKQMDLARENLRSGGVLHNEWQL